VTTIDTSKTKMGVYSKNNQSIIGGWPKEVCL